MSKFTPPRDANDLAWQSEQTVGSLLDYLEQRTTALAAADTSLSRPVARAIQVERRSIERLRADLYEALCEFNRDAAQHLSEITDE
jgi:hypothetical protein